MSSFFEQVTCPPDADALCYRGTLFLQDFDRYRLPPYSWMAIYLHPRANLYYLVNGAVPLSTAPQNEKSWLAIYMAFARILEDDSWAFDEPLPASTDARVQASKLAATNRIYQVMFPNPITSTGDLAFKEKKSASELDFYIQAFLAHKEQEKTKTVEQKRIMDNLDLVWRDLVQFHQWIGSLVALGKVSDQSKAIAAYVEWAVPSSQLSPSVNAAELSSDQVARLGQITTDFKALIQFALEEMVRIRWITQERENQYQQQLQQLHQQEQLQALQPLLQTSGGVSQQRTVHAGGVVNTSTIRPIPTRFITWKQVHERFRSSR